MLSFLLAVHFVLTLSIIALIMLQKHDSDGALGSSGGGAASGMFSVRGQANILTKATAILMTIFMINCLVMAKIVKHTPAAHGSIIDKVAAESDAAAKHNAEKSTPISPKASVPTAPTKKAISIKKKNIKKEVPVKSKK